MADSQSSHTAESHSSDIADSESSHNGDSLAQPGWGLRAHSCSVACRLRALGGTLESPCWLGGPDRFSGPANSSQVTCNMFLSGVIRLQAHYFVVPE